MKTACLPLVAVVASLTASAVGFDFYNIVPCIPGEEMELAAEMAEYHVRTGNRTVLYCLPCHPEGVPATAKIDSHIKSYSAFAAACRAADPDLRVGILIQSVLGHFAEAAVVGDAEPWQGGINAAGKPYRWCPLDPRFRAYVTESVRRLAAEKPCFVMTDDDLGIRSGECFCPLHVAELNRRTKFERSADDWRKAVLASRTGESDYEVFFRLQRETIEGLYKLIRAAVDEVDPTIPGGICMCGEEYRFCGPLSRAMAAKGQRPVMRIADSLYLEHQRGEYATQEALTRAQSLAAIYEGEDIDLLDEADTWPQHLWSKSAITFHQHIIFAAFCGLKGAKIWYVNAHWRGGDRISRNYTDALATHRGYYDALISAFEGTRAVGVITPTIIKDAEWHAARPRMIDANFARPVHTWAEYLFGFAGVPTTASARFDRDGIWELSGADTIARLTDDEIRTLLSHRVLVDGPAAVALSSRGFSDLIGADAQAESLKVNGELDLEGRSCGRIGRSDAPPRYVPHPGARVSSYLVFSEGAKAAEKVAPGTILFSNRLGGTIALTAYGHEMLLYHRIDVMRRAWLERTLVELNGGRFDFIVRNEQDTVSLVRETLSGTTAYVGVFNLNYDPLPTVRLTCANRPKTVSRLAFDATWHPVDILYRDGELSVPAGLPCMGEIVLRVELIGNPPSRTGLSKIDAADQAASFRT